VKHSTYLLRAVAAMVAVSTVFGAQANTGLNATVYSDWERGGVARGSTGDITFAGLTPVGSFLDPAIDHWDDTNFYLVHDRGPDGVCDQLLCLGLTFMSRPAHPG
jgi:hypothetical protein